MLNHEIFHVNTEGISSYYMETFPKTYLKVNN